MIQLSQSLSAASHVAFDPDHPYERIYFLVHPKARRVFAERFWRQNPFRAMDLNDVAMIAGGKHGRRRDYAHVAVKPIGVLTAIAYSCEKKGDGPSNYLHEVGEVSHRYPFLCCDAKGRLFPAGGAYTSPNPGISD